MPLKLFYNKTKDIFSRVQQAGIDATLIEDKNKYLEKIGVKVKDIDYTRWVMDINGQHFDYIVRYYCYHQGGSENYLNYIVAGNPNKPEIHTDKLIESRKGLLGKISSKNWWISVLTRGIERDTNISLEKVKGKVVDVRWKGEDLDLSLRLESDSILKEKIIDRSRTNKDVKKIRIFHMSREDYGVIQTENFKPTPEDFEIMNMIARHIKSLWFGL